MPGTKTAKQEEHQKYTSLGVISDMFKARAEGKELTYHEIMKSLKSFMWRSQTNLWPKVRQEKPESRWAVSRLLISELPKAKRYAAYTTLYEVVHRHDNPQTPKNTFILQRCLTEAHRHVPYLAASKRYKSYMEIYKSAQTLKILPDILQDAFDSVSDLAEEDRFTAYANLFDKLEVSSPLRAKTLQKAFDSIPFASAHEYGAYKWIEENAQEGSSLQEEAGAKKKAVCMVIYPLESDNHPEKMTIDDFLQRHGPA
ncbi:MAG TPA: hypothetical protein DEA55_00520 [Rhodospirillaceae bacterium]|nr:hypothetical protein [Rhodospirillaceae bacterium]